MVRGYYQLGADIVKQRWVGWGNFTVCPDDNVALDDHARVEGDAGPLGVNLDDVAVEHYGGAGSLCLGV